MHKGQTLVRSARELNKVKAVALETLAEKLTVVGSEAAVLELDAVDFDAQAERRVCDASADGVGDLKDDAGAVFERAAVLVSSFVGSR